MSFWWRKACNGIILRNPEKKSFKQKQCIQWEILFFILNQYNRTAKTLMHVLWRLVMSSDGFTDFLSLNDQILLMAFFIVQKFFINFFPNFSPKFSKIFSKISIFWWSPKSIIKVGVSPSKTTCLICFIESHLKLLENTFYFILKLFSFSRYLNFCNDFLVM